MPDLEFDVFEFDEVAGGNICTKYWKVHINTDWSPPDFCFSKSVQHHPGGKSRVSVVELVAEDQRIEWR